MPGKKKNDETKKVDKTKEVETKEKVAAPVAKPTKTKETTPAPPAWQADWDVRVGAFATAVGKTAEEITTALEKDLIESPGTEALEILSDDEYSPFDDIKDAFSGIVKGGVLRRNIHLLRGEPSKSEKAASLAETSAKPGEALPGLATAYDLLPAVPTDAKSLLEALQSGGVPKVDDLLVYSLVRSAFADRQKYFRLPQLFLDRLETYSESVEEPLVGEAAERYIRIRNVVVERKYADILGPMGYKGNIMTKANIDKVLTRMESYFWNGLRDFHTQLEPWFKMWLESSGPAALGNFAQAFAHVLGGASPIGTLPTAPIEPPDTSGIRIAARSFYDVINKVCAGLGVPVTKALAGEAVRIQQMLDDPQLAQALGYPTKDLMLKELKISVSPDIVMMENIVASYALGVLGIRNIEAEGNVQKEYAYLGALYQRGRQLNWELLLNRNPKTSSKTEKEF